MAKKNDSFFVEKKAWSIVKDELLGCYLTPYISKILHTRKPLAYIDCFAGKGKFNDGNQGSPLIAVDIIQERQSKAKIKNTRIEAIFIELNHADDLRENLKSYPWVEIVSGKYEENILGILRQKQNYNVFMYIDPYGFKALKYSLFDYFAKERFNTVELLVNMNSFGFIREACSVLGASFSDIAIFEDLVEYEPSKMDNSDKSIKELNDIAGGKYWQTIIQEYKMQKINGYEAESLFVQQYCMRLTKKYKYVLNMPLRIKRNQRPKYRLIHVTNHPSACLLMVDNICNRWQVLQEIQTGRQQQLFEEDYNNCIVDSDETKKMVTRHFSECSDWINLSEALAMFFIKHGPICKTGKIKEMLKQLEKQQRLDVRREPSKTTKGEPTSFMSESPKKSVHVRWCQ